MGIEATCGQCGKQYTVPDRWAGKRVQCPRCQAEVDVPVQAINVVITQDNVPAATIVPAADINPPTATTPFAQPKTPPSKRQWKNAPVPQQPDPLSGPQSNSASTFGGKFLQGSSLMIAVGVGMGLVLVWALVVLISTGFGFWLLPHAFLLAAGATILTGGVKKKSVHRNQANVKNRTWRIAGWLLAGLCGAGAAIVGMWGVARMGVPVPSVAIVGTPLLLVPLLVSFVAAILLAYNFLILMFPTANIFRIIAMGYVAMTVVIPVIMIPIGIVGSMTGGDRRTAAVPNEPTVDDNQPANLKPSFTPPRPDSTRNSRSAPEKRDPTTTNPQDTETGGTGSTTGSSMGPGSGTVGRFPGRVSPGSRRPGAGFRGPPSSRPGTGRSGPSKKVPSFEASVATLVSRYGAERVVTVLAEPVEGSQFSRVSDAIRTAAHADRTGYAASLSNGMLRAAVGPVNDIQAFSERLTIGEVVDVDLPGRTITVEIQLP